VRPVLVGSVNGRIIRDGGRKHERPDVVRIETFEISESQQKPAAAWATRAKLDITPHSAGKPGRQGSICLTCTSREGHTAAGAA